MSGSGVHLYAFGRLPSGARKKGQIEVYESGRYFTVTGDHVPGTPLTVEDRGDRLRAFHQEVFGAAAVTPGVSTPVLVSAHLNDVAVVSAGLKERRFRRF